MRAPRAVALMVGLMSCGGLISVPTRDGGERNGDDGGAMASGGGGASAKGGGGAAGGAAGGGGGGAGGGNAAAAGGSGGAGGGGLPVNGVGTGATYFVATTGSDTQDGRSVATPFRTVAKALAVVGPGGVIEVRAGTYRENLIVRTRGTASAWITLRGYAGERPVLRGTGAGPTLYFYDAACDEDTVGLASGNVDCAAFYWVVSGLEVQGSPSGGGDGNAVKIDVAKVKLQGNRLCCAVADVVKLVRTANDVELRGNELWQDAAVTAFSANAQAVDIVGADRTVVADNFVHDVPDIGIYAKGNARNPLFEGNLLVDLGSNALMLGQSTDLDRLVDGDYETYDGIVRNNVVVNCAWACLATSSSKSAHLLNNSCFNTGTTTHGSVLLSNESEKGTAGDDIELWGNVIFGSANRPVLRMTSNAMANYATLKVDRNLYWVGGGQPQFSAEDLFTPVPVAQWRTRYQGFTGRTDSSLVADPLFATTSGAAALTLTPQSPALGAGVAHPLVPTDKRGIARPASGAADLGAYEY